MKTLLSDGIQIAYVDHAASTPPLTPDVPVILIHGFASTHTVNWVNTVWAKTLTHAGYRTIMLDNRGHGASQKLYEPDQYNPEMMALDVVNLMDHLALEKAHVMGYSMGARVTAYLAALFPKRVDKIVLGGLGMRLIEGAGLPQGLAHAMEAPTLDALTDPMHRMFRAFADANKADLRALAACIIGSRDAMREGQLATIEAPTLVAVGTHDPIAGSAQDLAQLMPNATAFDIVGRDHNLAVGDKTYKKAVLDFLQPEPV
jgi:pimeloyl-ACP methyl ester carboxylesterase